MKKTGAILAILMFASIIAGGFALAQTGLAVKETDASISVSAFAEVSPEVDVADVIDVVDVVDASLNPSDRAVGFKQATIFHGYATSDSGERGAFVGAAWAEQSFVRGSDIAEEKVVSKGRIKIGTQTYVLERTDDANAEDLTLSFNLLRGNSVVGSLDLRLESAVNPSFRIWNGELEISNADGQEDAFSGNIHGASRTHVIRSISAEDRAKVSAGPSDAAIAFGSRAGEDRVNADADVRDASEPRGFGAWIRGLFVRDKAQAQAKANVDADIDADIALREPASSG